MRNNKIRLTESQLHNVIKESVKKVLREERQSMTNDKKQLAHSFLNWVESGECDWCGKPTYAWEGMCDYYNQGIDGKLYIAAEAFAKSYGGDVDEILDAAKYATKMYFKYNPTAREQVKQEYYDKMEKHGYHMDNGTQKLLTNLFMPK